MTSDSEKAITRETSRKGKVKESRVDVGRVNVFEGQRKSRRDGRRSRVLSSDRRSSGQEPHGGNHSGDHVGANHDEINNLSCTAANPANYESISCEIVERLFFKPDGGPKENQHVCRILSVPVHVSLARLFNIK